jgi:hypothetical protein
MRFREKIARFMAGRNGADQLLYVFFALYIVIAIVNSFVSSLILEGVLLLLIAYILFRMFSRNISKRRAENARLMKVWYKIRPGFMGFIRQIKEIRTHRYRRCPHCKARIRLPRKPGRHTVTCPACKKDFNVNILI